MKANRFTAEQIVAILHEAAAGEVVRELCRRHGIIETTFYRWRRPYGGRCPGAGSPARAGRRPAPLRLRAARAPALARRTRREPQARVPALPGRAPSGAAPSRPQARRGAAGAAPRADRGQSALWDGLHSRRMRRWPALPLPHDGGRVHPRVPGDRDRHLAPECPCHRRARAAGGAARLTAESGRGSWARVHLPGRWISGPIAEGSSWCSFAPGSRWRTPMSRASTAASATSA